MFERSEQAGRRAWTPADAAQAEHGGEHWASRDEPAKGVTGILYSEFLARAFAARALPATLAKDGQSSLREAKQKLP